MSQFNLLLPDTVEGEPLPDIRQPLPNRVVQPLSKESGWNSQPQAGQGGLSEIPAHLLGVAPLGRHIQRIGTRHGHQSLKGILGLYGKRPDLVERGGKGHQSRAGNSPIGGLNPDDSAEGRRLTDGSPGVGAKRQGGKARRYRRCRPPG